MDFERERDEYIKRMTTAVNRLSQKEREIIIKAYFDKEEISDYVIYNELGYSETNYYKHKRKALDKLAVILGYISPNELLSNK